MERLKIAIADDHQLFREGLKFILHKTEEFEVILEAEDGQDLMEKILHQKPDIILMDLKMPKLDGIQATKLLKLNYPEIKIIILSMHKEEDVILYLLDMGANAYLLKNDTSKEMVHAIKRVWEKDYYFNDYISKVMLGGLKRKRKAIDSLDNPIKLTKREEEILKLIGQEYTTTEMAEKLFLSDRTIETHRKNILQKFEVKNTAGLIMKAIKFHMIEMEGVQ